MKVALIKKFLGPTLVLTLVFWLGAFSVKNFDLIRVPGFIGQAASAMCTLNPEALQATIDPVQEVTVDQVVTYMSGFPPCDSTNYFGSIQNRDGSVIYVYRFDYTIDGNHIEVPFVFITNTDQTALASIQ